MNPPKKSRPGSPEPFDRIMSKSLPAKSKLLLAVAASLSMLCFIWLSASTTSTSTAIMSSQTLESGRIREVNACILVLVRNGDLNGILKTLSSFERTFNQRFGYPYVFLNDVEFTEEFKSRISEATNATVEFGVIPREHWSYPTFIDQQRAQREMRRLGQNGVPYGDMMSYHHMCRYYSGFFFRHELLKKYDYYWRIEPDVEFYCELLYDPFKVMKKNNKKYGYVIVATEFMETVPTLWKTTMSYIEEKGMEFPSHLNAFYDQKTKDYNGVHFWSNFEIGDLNWFRGSEYLSYFEYLDRAGGFFYERWGDAPVHSVAAGLLLKEHEMHFFYDIGYKHMDRVHCPAELPSKGIIAKSRCTCDAQNVREWVYRDAPWRKAFDTYMAHIDNVGAQHVGEQ